MLVSASQKTEGLAVFKSQFQVCQCQNHTEYVSAAWLLCFVTQGFELDPDGWERASKYSHYAVLDHWLDVGRAEFFRNNPTRA